MELVIEKTLTELLEKIGVKIQKIDTEKEEEHKYKINISSPDSSLLIGYGGTTLNAIEHILNTIIKRRENEAVRILVDVDNYRKRQEESVLSLADRKSEVAKKTGRPQILPPMSAYYRRVVHLHVAEKFSDVVTESIGEGERRQIVIKAKDEDFA